MRACTRTHTHIHTCTHHYSFDTFCSRLTSLLINIANYDGTDIARPYIVNNTNGTTSYTYLDEEDYQPPSHSKRAATSNRYHLWPYGIIQYSLDSRFSGNKILVLGFLL